VPVPSLSPASATASDIPLPISLPPAQAFPR
jgi:hypothetical protein